MSEKSTSKSEQQYSSTSSLTRISSSSSSLAVTHNQESNLSAQLPQSHQRSSVGAPHLLQRINGTLPSYSHVKNNVMLRSGQS